MKSVIYESGVMPDTMSFLHNQPIDYWEITNWEARKQTPLNEEEKGKLDEDRARVKVERKIYEMHLFYMRKDHGH